MKYKKEIEEILRNKILFIGKKGDGTPNFKDTDHQVYTGYPQLLIDELQALIDRAVREERERIINKVDNIMDIERASDLKESLKTFGHEICPMCGFDPIHQRNYMLSHLNDSEK